MHSFIMKITHSLASKDAIAVARGMYKVIEGGINAYREDNANVKMTQSWHEHVSQPKKQQTSQTNNFTVKQKPQQKVSKSVNSDPNQNSTQERSSVVPPQHQKSQTIVETQIPIRIRQVSSSSVQQKFQSKPQPKQANYKDILKNSNLQKNNVSQEQKVMIESKVPSSRISRIFQFTKLGLNIAQSAVGAYFAQNDDSQKQAEAYEKIANKITDELCKMRGAPLKLAQMLSIQEDKLIPTPIRRAFEKARQTAHILPPQQVLYQMQKNFGQDWRKKFIKFEQKPFASASIGQVHLATLPSRQQVAIKIQYPGVRKSIQSDISNLHLLMKIPGVFPKGMFMERILKNTKLQLTQQCDYILQKQKQQAYEKCLNICLKDGSKLYKVPGVFQDLTTDEIFSSEYLQGITMKALQENDYPQEIRDQVGRRIMEITFNELFEMGIVQSDPNPSNFTYNLKNDQLNLFDFGATHIYKRKFLQDYYRIIEGSVIQNKEQILSASVDTGFLTGEEGEAMKQNHVESILITGEPLRFKGKYDFGNQKITEKIYKTIPVMLKNRLKHPPQQVYSLHRKLSGSYLACMRLKARVDCSKIWDQIKFQRIIQTIEKGQNSRLII